MPDTSDWKGPWKILGLIDEPYQTQLKNLFRENKDVIRAAWGSVHNHQAWEGGYLDHVGEIMNIAVQLYPVMSALRSLPFSLSDALICLFLHDIEKPWKYKWSGGVRVHSPEFQTKEDDMRFRYKLLGRYEIVLPNELWNGIKYAEGELGDYTNRARMMSPLAAFVHMCDVASARIWFGHPYLKNDPWFGAYTSSGLDRDWEPFSAEESAIADKIGSPAGSS